MGCGNNTGGIQCIEFIDIHKDGIKLSELDIKDFKAAAAKIDKDVYDCLSAANIVKAYKSEGAAGTMQVTKQIDYWKKQLK